MDRLNTGNIPLCLRQILFISCAQGLLALERHHRVLSTGFSLGGKRSIRPHIITGYLDPCKTYKVGKYYCIISRRYRGCTVPRYITACDWATVSSTREAAGAMNFDIDRRNSKQLFTFQILLFCIGNHIFPICGPLPPAGVFLIEPPLCLLTPRYQGILAAPFSHGH